MDVVTQERMSGVPGIPGLGTDNMILQDGIFAVINIGDASVFYRKINLKKRYIARFRLCTVGISDRCIINTAVHKLWQNNCIHHFVHRPPESYDNGSGNYLIPGADPRIDYCRLMRESIASRKWLEEAGECVKQFCQEVWDTPEGRAVVAIHVAGAVNGEWHGWGPDCSKPMQERFTRFLKEKYGTDEALQAAWGDPDATIDTARIHSDNRQQGTDGLFRDPIGQRSIMDSQECLQIVIPEAIVHFAKIVKENWGRPILVGTFYGFVPSATNPVTGHFLPHILYENREYIDFFGGCARSGIGESDQPCDPMHRGVLESLRLHGMLWLTEMDKQPKGTRDFVGGDPARMGESIGTLRCNVLAPIMAGHGLWYYDHRDVVREIPRPKLGNPLCDSLYVKTGWWDNPTLLKEIGWLQQLASTYGLKKHESIADVLVVCHQEACLSVRYSPIDHYAIHEALVSAGVVYDSIYLRDLELDNLDIDRYKCIIFPDAYNLTTSQKEMIAGCTKGKHVVWLYAPGYSDESTLDIEHIRELTGITVRRTQSKSQYRVLENGKDMPIKYDGAYEPFFAVDDSEAEALAVYEESGECAIARKGNNWYYTVPRMDVYTARKFLKAAGVHCYCESGDAVFAGNGLVLVHTQEGGEREILFRNGKRTGCYIEPLSTAVFDEETGERLDG